MEFRALTEKEIDARVATVNEKGCSLLLYKDARCDMRILDESVGSERWQRKHELINGNLFCNVGINFPAEDGDHWVWKQDVGTESYTEKEKDRHRILSSVLALTGELEENFTLHHIYGFLQRMLHLYKKIISGAHTISSRLNKLLLKMVRSLHYPLEMNR